MARGRSVAQIEHDAHAVELRRQNLSYRQIAVELGYRSVSNAWEAVQRGLLDAIREPADQVRHLELERLDALAQVAWRVLADRHYAVAAGGKVALHPETGAPLIDDGPTLAAIDKLLRIQERRAKLLGLDAPTKHEVVTMDAIEAEIAKLRAEMDVASVDPRASQA